MMTEPASDWTPSRLETLIAEGANETEDLEFKSAAVLRAPNGASSLSKAVTAFANGRGGTIVIGVADGPPRVIEGFAASAETVKHINDRIKVYPRPALPAPTVIAWRDGLSVAVVHVPASTVGPHASVADGKSEFFVRTHSGSEPMGWAAIRDSMVKADERRRQGELLLAQFEQHFMTARNLLHGTREQHDFPITDTFDMTLTHLALAAVHPWLARDNHAPNDVGRLLGRMNHINGQVQAMIADVAANPKRLQPWRGRLGAVMGGFRDQLVQAEAGVRRVLDFPQPDYRNKYPEW